MHSTSDSLCSFHLLLLKTIVFKKNLWLTWIVNWTAWYDKSGSHGGSISNLIDAAQKSRLINGRKDALFHFSYTSLLCSLLKDMICRSEQFYYVILLPIPILPGASGVSFLILCFPGFVYKLHRSLHVVLFFF